MIGIIGAMKIEVDALCAAMTDKQEETVSGITFYCGTLYGTQAVVAECGVGKVFAAMCAQTMILRYGTDRILNTGVGGSLSPDLHVTDVALSTACVQHDMDTSALGDPKGMISGINVIALPCDEALRRTAQKAAEGLGVHTQCGVIVSGDRFIGNREEKTRLSRDFDGIACDMESAAIAHVCYVNRVPFLAIRAISDNADGAAELSFAEFAALSAKQSIEIIRLMLEA
ncbi:MAG: 5'-methylthioadenosine/adenosylhomocysteine nucleosidase [Ruminococcaceae bacterium]|nr:5'-methylthioadenosine/adenosylhomocysteine nucleosidase [Oscillospiraceae bacterium]